jgi:hypothetical protein
MKHTEKQILEKAIKIVKDLDGEQSVRKVNSVRFVEKKKLAVGIDKDKEYPCWTVYIESLFGNEDHLTISDDTAEPLYYQNFNLITLEIIKNADSIYQYKK